jgi:crotonobetainyl-CoA:carnitine CoA-transferase CaiB-like acyl-CoA transferase
LANLSVTYHRTGTPFRPMGGAQTNVVPYQVFRTSDGWMVVACLTQKFWVHLCRAMERPDLLADARFSSNARRVRNRDDLIPTLDKTFLSRPTAHWMTLLEEGDVPCSPVNRLEDVFRDPQVINNKMSLVLRHPVQGEVVTVNNPVHLSATPAKPWGYPPDIGEHTDEVLTELGYDPRTIRALRDTGVAR